MIGVRVLRVGRTAAMLDVATSEEALAWRDELWRRRDAGELTAADIVSGARTVLVDGCPDVTGFISAVSGWVPPDASATVEGVPVTIPMRYDGDDLEWVAGQLGTSVDGFIACHLDTEFRVAFCGFAPGFAYMTGLGVSLPRLATPRPRVPAGSVALADTYCGIYPSPSPGGWRLIGSTDVPLFDPMRDPPATLAPGSRVRFARVAP
jgi:KipI family sensor histidine kinase inhibitor